MAEFSIPTAIARSDFRAAVDVEECVGCGDCVERYQFGALSVAEEVCVVDYARCVGCGQCTTVCPSEALGLERRPKGEVPSPPSNRKEWMAERARARGISVSDLL